MTSALPLGNHESQRFLGQRFFEAWQQSLFKGPFFETIPPYDRLESLAQKFSGSLANETDKIFATRFHPIYSCPDVVHKLQMTKSFLYRIRYPTQRPPDFNPTPNNRHPP